MSERSALVIGMSYYDDLDELPAAVNDSREMERVLEIHFDTTKNFEVRRRVSVQEDPITASTFLAEFDIFLTNSDDTDLVFYFSGHGLANQWGMQLLMADQSGGSGLGVPFETLMYRATQARFASLTCILDCCYAGTAWKLGLPDPLDFSFLRRNVTILASSSGDSFYDQDLSDYTRILVEGFEGAATDPSGHVTAFELHRLAAGRLRDGRNGSPVLKSNCSDTTDLRSPSGR